MGDLNKIKADIKQGKLDDAIHSITHALATDSKLSGTDKSELYYLLGNAHRKTGDFHLAMDYYTKAIEENPESPAVEARKVLHGIMSFYNKDMYNH